VFTHVGIKASARAVVRDTKRLHRPTHPVEVAAPGQPRGVVRTRVEHGLPYPVIHATLKDKAGRPAAYTSFFWSLSEGKHFMASGHVRSDAQGRLSFVVRRVPLPKAAAPRIEMWRSSPIFGLRITPPPSAKARANLQRWPLPPGPTRLGELVLEPVPVLVQGRVIDAAGRPLAHATVNITVTPTGSRHPHIHQVDAGADGMFTAHVDPAGLELEIEIRARARGYEPTTLRVTAGTTDVKIVLSRRQL
jgi:hypothetical protein